MLFIIFFLVLLTFKYIFFLLNFELEYKLLSYKIHNTLISGSHMYILKTMLLYENLLCIYDVIMIYLKICWFYFSFVFFSRLIQTWNMQRLIGGTSHWNKIWMSTSTVQKTWLFKKKNRQLTILLEIPNLSHTVNIKKWGKR